MRILIDIGHPGHVHYFKNLIARLKQSDHQVLITARNTEIIVNLLNNFDIPYISRGKGQDSRFGKFIYMIQAVILLLKISLKFKPDLFLSFSSPYAAQTSFLLGKYNIALNDTEHTDKIHSFFTYPFCSHILTPESFYSNIGNKQIRFDSVVESLYLSEENYKPDPSIFELLNLRNDEEYVIIRFVSWNAHHDFGQSGLDIETKRGLINILEDRYRIFISSEGDLDEEFSQFKINIPPERMHDALAYATLFIGESATMASESTLLGTFAIYINSLPLMGYLRLEQSAGLLKYFRDSINVLPFVEELIQNSLLKRRAIENSKAMQESFIKTNDFLFWFIDDYPKSARIINENPKYQDVFR